MEILNSPAAVSRPLRRKHIKSLRLLGRRLRPGDKSEDLPIFLNAVYVPLGLGDGSKTLNDEENRHIGNDLCVSYVSHGTKQV